MNGIPDFILIVVIFDIVVVLLIATYLIKRKKKKKEEQNVAMQTTTLQTSFEGKTLHRCPKCSELFENPAKEIVYVTEPPTERLICPKCFTPLRQLITGKLRVGRVEEVGEEEEVEEKHVWRYDLVAEPTKLAEVLSLLAKKGLNPVPIAKGDKIHVIITSDRELSFNKLKEKGMILDWRKETYSTEKR